MNNIGHRIYELRQKENISQDHLADLLGVSRQAISKWENSQSVPELEKIVQMSEIFDVSLDYLIKGKESPSTGTLPEQVRKEESGFSKDKIRQIFGFIFIGLGIMALMVNLMYAATFIAEGLFLVYYKSNDVHLIIGVSLFILMIVPFACIFLIGLFLGFTRG